MKRLFFGLTGLMVLVVAAAGCEGDDGNSTSTAKGKDMLGNCVGQTGQECTGTDEYTDCLTSACDTEYKDMLGSDYLSGKWGGKCATYMTCNLACDCGDNACNLNCLSDVSQDCEDAIDALSTCVQTSSCTLPKCTSTGNGGAKCEELKSCCDEVIDALKPSCNAIVDAGADLTCEAALSSYCSVF